MNLENRKAGKIYQIEITSANRFAPSMESNERKSPLRTKPRRAAGQSVQQELDRLREAWMEKASLAVLAIVLLLLEFWRWGTKMQPNPLGAAVICIPLFFWSIYRMRNLRPRMKNLKQGLDGERIVAEQLETLRSHGYRVVHDLVGGDFNVDYVLVGPTGVFAIETKTWSKRPGEKIESDGKFLWKNGIQVEPNPIDQAKAQARWLHGLIKELTNENVFVQSVVVFPGWWVECKVREPQTIILNPDQLVGYLKNIPARLDEKDIGFIANRVEFLVRTK